MDATELLLWTVMKQFESLAVERYRDTAPQLASAKKHELLAALRLVAADESALASTNLAQPVKSLMEAAHGKSEADTLLVQGLLLEPLGRAIYRAAGGAKDLSAEGAALASLGAAASDEVCQAVPLLIEASLGTGEKLFASFAGSTRPILSQLDVMGELLDAHFGDRLQLRFADLLGEVAGELLPACAGLGMNRRKVVCHLTSALMSAA